MEHTIDRSKAQYAYDDEIRLSGVTRDGLPEQQFALDAMDNRIADSALPGEWEYDDNNRLPRQGATRYEYDENGNLVRKIDGAQVTRFIYDTTDRLVQVEDGSGNIIARYGYDPFGRGLWKQAAERSIYLLYAEEGLIGEYYALGQEIKAYGWLPDGIWSTDPVFLKQGQRYFYYQNDHLGTPHRLVDRDGAVMWAAAYTAFGHARVAAGSTVESNLRLPGQYFDQESGLHYNKHRYYAPSMGRYLREDPVLLFNRANLHQRGRSWWRREQRVPLREPCTTHLASAVSMRRAFALLFPCALGVERGLVLCDKREALKHWVKRHLGADRFLLAYGGSPAMRIRFILDRTGRFRLVTPVRFTRTWAEPLAWLYDVVRYEVEIAEGAVIQCGELLASLDSFPRMSSRRSRSLRAFLRRSVPSKDFDQDAFRAFWDEFGYRLPPEAWTEQFP